MPQMILEINQIFQLINFIVMVMYSKQKVCHFWIRYKSIHLFYLFLLVFNQSYFEISLKQLDTEIVHNTNLY